MKKISETSIEQLKSISPDSLVAHGIISTAPNHKGNQGYCCPMCDSGTGQNHNGRGDGAGTFDAGNRFYCHACNNAEVGGHKLSTIDLFAIARNLQNENFVEQCRKMASEFSIPIEMEEVDTPRKSFKKTSKKIVAIQPPVVDDKELDLIHEDLFKTSDSHLQTFLDKKCGGKWRGFDFDFLVKHGCKYIENWRPIKSRLEGKYCTPTPRILIPAGADSYLARFVGNLNSYDDSTRKFVEDNQKLHAGTKTLFNADVLTATEPVIEPVIAVEGYVDCMSIELAGFKAVGLGGANRTDLLVNAVKALEKKPRVLILLDSDATGRDASKKLYDALIKVGCPCVARFLADDESKVDCNQILVEQGLENLRGILQKLVDDSLDELAAVEEEISKNVAKVFSAEEREFYFGGGLTIATVHDVAKRYGYQESKSGDIFREIRSQCKWSHDKNGNPTKIKSDVFNYEIIFERDPNLRGLFGRDTFRQETVFLKRAPWHDKNMPLKDTWDDSDDSELRLYLAKHYAEMGTPQRTLDFVVRAARENSFHAIRNFFEGLPEWDGVARAETLFTKFLGADNSDYTRAVTKHFLIGAIARAFYPGCDFQSVVVLQGAQGIGKSRLLRMLGGKHNVNPKAESWHIALRDQLDDSHAVDAMRKGWIVEIEEFAAASHADVNALKGVLSADDVTRRFAYDRHAKTIKAHWIFAATCNDDAPLRDQTGNRRFLPIKCHNKESEIVDGMTPEYIRQVWAEAYCKFKEMFPSVDSFDDDKLRLSPNIQAQAAERADSITTDDGLLTEIKSFLNRKIPPLVIWHLLSKEERRKYHVDGGKISLELEDVKARFKNWAGRRFDEFKPTFDTACEAKDGFVRLFTDKNDRWIIVFYGLELRQHICAGEIFNECFGQDNRKRMPRINETLARLDGWHAGERLQRADPCYYDQKKPYYRNSEGRRA